MKILIVTQAVDQNNTTLGFFVGWIRKIAKRVESVQVIALGVGEYVLPDNVFVYSLGKEHGTSRFRRAWRFLSLLIGLRREYDMVFVHMNQEYIILGGLLWKILGKKILFWRNHPRGDWLTRVAVALSDKVFYTARQSFTAQYAKAHIMPVGVDTSMFYPGGVEGDTTDNYRRKYSVLVFGRIAPIKRIEVAIAACQTLVQQGVDLHLTIVGDTLPRDYAYRDKLIHLKEQLVADDWINFVPGVPFEKAPDVYRIHEILLNCTESGSFDKTIIEALACGMKVVTTNQSVDSLLSVPTDSEIPIKIKELFTLDYVGERAYEESAKAIVQSQSLDMLVGTLIALSTSPLE